MNLQKNNKENPDSFEEFSKKFKPNLFLIIMIIMSLIMFFYRDGATDNREISYSKLQEIIKNDADSITRAEFDDNGMVVRLYHSGNEFDQVRLPKNLASNNNVLDQLAQANIPTKVTKSQGEAIIFFLINFAPLILIALFLLPLLRGMFSGGSGGIGFLKSKAKLFKQDNVKVTFEDVAGIDEAKNELEEVVEFLKNPKKFHSLGAKIPKGVLLVGPPGTGKTLLAKAIAGEADVPFYSISGSDFVEMFAGLGASRVRDLFEQARKNAPCIVFVDEIDAVGRQRGMGYSGGHDEREQTLNQMLVEMDGFEDNGANVIVLAATNRADVLDKALTRPGRFDRQVSIDAPDAKGREKILEVHSKGKTLADEVNIRTLAKRTPGFTGAQLANVMNESALIAASRNKKEIDNKDVDDAVDKVWMGVRKFYSVPFKELRMTAYHETGHAIMALLDEQMPLHKVTIIPRSMAMGVTWSLSKDDHTHWTQSSLISRIKVAFGGKVAEELVFGDTTAGVVADLENATNIARKMVMQFGMSDLGPISFTTDTAEYFAEHYGGNKSYSDEMAKQIDFEVQKLLKEQYAEVKEYIAGKKREMDAIVLELLKHETLDEKEVKEIIEQVANGEYPFEKAEAEVKEIEEKLSRERELKTEDYKKELKEESNVITLHPEKDSSKDN